MKIGDKVKVIGSRTGGSLLGRAGTLVSFVDGGNSPYWTVRLEGDIGTTSIYQSDLQLISNNKTNMNIKEKFLLAFLGEPEKSFRKAGITNGDGFLTEDGQKVFLGWLLKQNGDAFKKEVVDGLLEEEEKNK